MPIIPSASILSDVAVFAGIALVALGVYKVAAMAILASRQRDDQAAKGQAKRGRRP
jgi:hypothetical protein